MSQWMAVAKTSDIASSQMKSYTIDENSIVVCNVDGSYYAFQDVCSHQELPLADGALTGKTVHCPWHGAQFDITTGEATHMPAVAPIVTYLVRVEADVIYVEVP